MIAARAFAYADDRCFGVWGGMVDVPVEERQAFYAALGRAPEAVLRLRYAVDPGLAIGESSGQAYGFYRDERGNNDRSEPSSRAPCGGILAAASIVDGISGK